MNFYRAALFTGAFIIWGILSAWKEAYGATDCAKHPVACHILRVAPHVKDATGLSNLVVRAAKKHHVDPHVLVAIIAQESSWRVGLHRVVVDGDANGCRVRVTDFGLAQINEHSIPLYGLDRERLLADVGYQIEAGAKILSDKLKTFGHWSAYHSMTPKFNQRYRDAVGRYL